MWTDYLYTETLYIFFKPNTDKKGLIYGIFLMLKVL